MIAVFPLATQIIVPIRRIIWNARRIIIVSKHEPTQPQPLVINDAIAEVEPIVGIFVQRMCLVKQSFAIASKSWIIAAISIHIRSSQYGANLHGRIVAIGPRLSLTIDRRTVVAETRASLHIATDIVIPTITDVPVIPEAQIHIMVIKRRTIEQLVIEEDSVVEGFIVGRIESVDHSLDFETQRCSASFGMRGPIVVEDEKQALVAFDVRIVAVGGIVMAVAVHIDKRRHVFGIAFLTMRRPSEYVFRNLVILVAVMGNEIVDFDTSQVPYMMVLQGRHQVNGSIGRF